MKTITIILTCLVTFAVTEKVLFLIPLCSKSHKNVFQPLINGMADRNHDVTVVSSYSPAKSAKRIRELVPTNFSVHMEAFGSDPFEKRKEGKMMLLTGNFNFMFDACDEAFQNEEFMNLLNEKFDLIYIGAVMNDCMWGFVHKLASPFIMVTTIAAPPTITVQAGNRLPPSFVPAAMFDYSDAMTFRQRVSNFLFNLIMELVNKYYFVLKFEAKYKNHMGQDLPSVDEISKNVSAIFMNSHFTLTYPRPTLPDVIEVGGMHCRPGNPLPKDIEEFVAGAKDGFIYFSLGSIVQANTMPDNVRKVFLNVFCRLKQRVLWKWETEMADVPANVKLLKWAPQQDILGHSNIRMFITHGGLLSTQEATYHGVPLIGFPIFGDQDLNMKQAERAGYALAVEILDVTEEILEAAIHRILNEKQFTERAKTLSSIFRDQPETPLERAIFWSEYIMRHKGAKHMRSAARDLNFFQYHSLDVIATLVTVLVTFLWIAKLIIFGLFRKLCGKKASVDNKKKRQ